MLSLEKRKPSVLKVFTYFEQDPELGNFNSLVEFWKQEWQAVGVEPVVLTLEDAKKHKSFDEVESHLKTLPSVTPRVYTEQCFRRWLAMDLVGGLHLDSDVLPNPKKIAYLKTFLNDLVELPFINTNVLQKDVCPCAVWVGPGFNEVIKGILKYDKPIEFAGKMHCTDQEFFRWFIPSPYCSVRDICSSYLDGDFWLEFPMIHFPTNNLPQGDKFTLVKSIYDGLK